MRGTPKTTRCAHDWQPTNGGASVRCAKCDRTREVGATTTTRLRRLDCADGCGYTIRLSRRWMDAGLPSCPCGGLLVPAAIEDADRALEHGHLTVAQYDSIPEVAELHHHLAGIAHGRSGSKDAGTSLARTADGRKPDLALAHDRLYRSRASEAYARRLAALEPHRFGGAPSTDDMPF
jgi:hypothetical protein